MLNKIYIANEYGIKELDETNIAVKGCIELYIQEPYG